MINRIFVYEYCFATGLGRDASDPAHSLYCEGKAMHDAIVADFSRIAGVQVVTQCHTQPDAERDIFRANAESADYTVVIAPESAGILLERTEIAESTSTQLLSPKSTAIAICADKLRLFELWKEHGIRTPDTRITSDWPADRLPMVVKPRDGAGSCETYRLNTNRDQEATISRLQVAFPEQEFIAQDWRAGTACSLAFLVGTTETRTLVPAYQHLTDDGRFRYLGGELPIPDHLAIRAHQLAKSAIAPVSSLQGYVGVDMVLGAAEDGSEDYVIEINPRLTTSYIGLRMLADFSLAEAMLKLLHGHDFPEFRWKSGRVRFDSRGRIEDLSPGGVRTD